MPVQSDQLIKEICSRLNAGGLTSLQTCQLQNASTIINNNKVFSVQSCSNLPLACENEGRLVYIRNIGAYRFSNGCTWESCLGSDPSRILCGVIFSWGTNICGSIGDGTTLNRSIPTREICSANDWCFVSVGQYTALGIKTNGELWNWGCNISGSLGDGTIVNRSSPVREFCSATDWCQASSGYCFTTAIKTSGQIWSWGTNANGVLGIGLSLATGRCSPSREFCSATDWCQVSAGTAFVSAIKTTGQLWSWGRNCAGSLGIGNSATLGRCSPVREFCSATDWCQVNSGLNIVGAIKTSNQLWTWGSNLTGGLGIGSSATIARCSPVREFCSATDWCQVSASISLNSSMSAVKTTGQLWSWGYNGNFRLGDFTSTSRCSPVREFCSASDWCLVARGSTASMGIKTTGQLFSWGVGTSGQLGSNSTATRCLPTIEALSLNDWTSVCFKRNQAIALAKVRQGFCL